MKPSPASLANLRPAQIGEIRNPGGKPVGARNRLQGKFMNALADDFEAHGKAAIVRMREEKPAEYVKCVASLMPKEFEISKPLDDVTDEQLEAAALTIRTILAAQADRLDAEGEREPEQA